ncbi:VOC family protein [Pseudonocardia bannensis]|uniref:VOC family protein n=1 Tax=Pseudonocardia bannensis TaxID=630973 RepID=A0A848DDY5_9PSEU|nr:VOC family protein [Pseudonocardia bannensis]NMH90804.1 VOC family protein [Pseudonocardia bannensis]
MRVVALDHIVLVTPEPERLIAWYRETLGLEPERLDAWRNGEVPFASLRVCESTIIDVLSGERTGANMEHVALVVDDVDLDALAAEHGVAAPKDLFGARGQGRGIYLRDPDGNGVELRSYA